VSQGLTTEIMNETERCHILLIGEPPRPDEQIMDILADQGRSVIYAESGQKAIEFLLEYDISIILIDITGRSSKGIEQARTIRSSERFKPIPIVFLLDRNPAPQWSWPDPPTGPIDIIIKPLNRFIVNHKLSLLQTITRKSRSERDLITAKKQLEQANAELQRLTEDLEAAITKANKMAVDAEIATISKSSFLASMSHEIRTPLNAVVGFSDLMSETDLNPDQQEYMDAIRSASNIFLELLNDILDFSKIEADMIHLETIPFRPEAVVDDVMGTLAVKAYEKKLELATVIADDVPEKVCGDPVRLKQIIMNLVGNAIKFTPEGEIIIRVKLAPEQAGNATCGLHISVADSGIGIPEAQQGKLFQPFCQAAHSTTREFGGTGLGLAISKRLVELMQGSIWIQSPNPESRHLPGTIFHVRALFKPADVVIDKNKKKWSVPNPNAGYRALVFHRNQAILKVLSHILGSTCKAVLTTDDPDEIVGVLTRERDADQAVTHVFLDDSDGASFVMNLSDMLREKAGYDGRIIIMARPIRNQSLSAQIEASPVDIWLRKPIRRSMILSVFESNRAEAPTQTGTEPRGPDLLVPPASLNILLVEDNIINQKVTQKMLGRLGHRVTIADNGKKAIDLIHLGQDFDLVLMDGQMPVMDGFHATEVIRRREVEDHKDRLPIIALTANAMKGDRERYIRAGMDDYIAKPVKIASLSKVIGRVIQRKKEGALTGQTLRSHGDVPVF
jgi:signal transduction histidine kinase/ActR/RegA family two-component response regulator